MKLTNSTNYDVLLSKKRKEFEFYYIEMILNKWLGKFKINGLSYRQEKFFLMRLWDTGSVAFCRPTNYDLLTKYQIDEMLGEESILVVRYAPSNRYNIYNYPTHAFAINNRGVKFIPYNELEIDKDIVIVYSQANEHSIFESIKSKIDKIVDLEMILYACNKIQKSNWALGINIDDKTAANGIISQLMSDKPFVIATFEQLKEVGQIGNNAPFISDKIEMMIQSNLDSIYTYLGFNNVGVLEKKEHLLDNEINANNEVIASNNDNFIEKISQGLDRVNSVFGTNISIELTNKEINLDSKDKDEEEQEND